MKESLKNQIANFIYSSKKAGISIKEIFAKFNNKHERTLLQEINSLLKYGSVFEQNEKFFSAKVFNLVAAKITRNCKNFCFAMALDDDTEYFITTKFSKNSLVNDIVLLSLNHENFAKNSSKKFLKEGKVFYICKQSDIKFTGTVVALNDQYYIKPDENLYGFFKIKNLTKKIKLNDKVIAKINRKNFDPNNPYCSIIKTFGNSNKAYVCAKACVENSSVPLEFSQNVLKEASKLKLKQNSKTIERLDLTNQIIFTIDSEKAKDLDDAISATKTDSGYFVGVHIADVSHFIEFKTEIDKEALNRGNSIYIANKVIPMLPTELSNDLCSLQPNKVKLTFSVLMNLDLNGNLLNFKIVKTKIKSRIKGIYEEVNQILNENYKNESIKNKLNLKYGDILQSLKTMLELCNKLKSKRINRGSPQLQSTECVIELNEKNEISNIYKKEQDLAEQIVEEFMLLANECVATFAKKNRLSIFYRTHENPPKEKVDNFRELIRRLGLNEPKIKHKLKSKVLVKLLQKHKDSPVFTILNSNILKTMAKAKYSVENEIHYGLALENYTHFTSPIRRYCDLMVHRILTEFLYKKQSLKGINKKYKNFLNKSAKTINKTEITAIKLERKCESYFKAEFMLDKIGQKFDAIITNCTKNGMFVQLPNTIEGFVKIETLNGYFTFDGFFRLTSKNKKTQFAVGQNLKVKCTAANVNSNTVNFIVCD